MRPVLLVVFLAAIGLPPLMTLFSPGKQVSEDEKRTLTAAPELTFSLSSIRAFPRAFEAYYGDHFGLRNTLTQGYTLARLRLQKISSAEDVVIGRDDWLFYGRQDLIDDHRGRLSWSDAELAAWKRELTARRDWLAERGVRYLYVVAPNKQSVYPEFMPLQFTKVAQGSRTDRWLAYLRRHTDIDILDLRQPLLAAKPEALVYQRTDTHWNDRGAFVAYRAMIGHLQNDAVHATPLAAYAETRKEHGGGDLAAKLGAVGAFPDYDTQLALREPPCAHVVPAKGEAVTERGKHPAMAATRCEQAVLTVLMLHDSFATKLMPFLSESFREITYVWSRYDQAMVEKLLADEQPDIVIEQSVERRMRLSRQVWN